MEAIIFETVRFRKNERTELGAKTTVTDIVVGNIVKVTFNYTDAPVIGRVSKIAKNILQVDSSEKHRSEVYDIMFKDIGSIEIIQ